MLIVFVRSGIGPSAVCALPLASGRNEGGHYFRYIHPSGVRALPLAAGINEGGHYFRYIIPLVGPSVLRAPAEQTKVATILGTFFFSLVLGGTVIQNSRKGCRRVSNFSMGS